MKHNTIIAILLILLTALSAATAQAQVVTIPNPTNPLISKHITRYGGIYLGADHQGWRTFDGGKSWRSVGSEEAQSISTQLYPHNRTLAQSRLNASVAVPSIFPNPSTGRFTLSLGENPKSGILTAYDIGGAVIEQWDVKDQSSISLDLSLRPAGDYLFLFSGPSPLSGPPPRQFGRLTIIK